MRKFLRILTSKALLTAVLMLIQFLALSLVLVFSFSNLWVFIITNTVVSWLFGFYIFNADMKVEHKLAWLVVILVLPIFGVFSYLVLGRNSKKNHRMLRYVRYAEKTQKYLTARPETEKAIALKDPFFARTAQYLGGTAWYPVYVCNDVEYYSCGEEFITAYLEELRKAKHFIFMEYFIISEGRILEEILKILEDKIAHGVIVRMIYDDFGTFLTLPPRTRRRLEKIGIKTMVFNPFRPLLDMSQNNRTHRKITVIDGVTAFTGGINLADEYVNSYERHGYWKDTAVCLRGACVANFSAMFLHSWSYRYGKEDYHAFFPPLEEPAADENFAIPFGEIPVDEEATYESLYIDLLYHAKKYVYITTPYLLIDTEMKKAIVHAVHSGVDVRILVPHVPDKKLVFRLTKAFYTELVKEGVGVYEYTPGFIHAKMMISDDRYTVVGTTNMDFRSFNLQYEDGVYFRNTELTAKIKADLDRSFEQSELMTKEKCKVRFVSRVARGMIKVFAPLL